MSDHSEDDFTSWEPLFDTGDNENANEGGIVAQTIDTDTKLAKPFIVKSESSGLGITEDSGEDNK